MKRLHLLSLVLLLATLPFVVANGDVENEEGEKAIANLMVAAIQ